MKTNQLNLRYFQALVFALTFFLIVATQVQADDAFEIPCPFMPIPAEQCKDFNYYGSGGTIDWKTKVDGQKKPQSQSIELTGPHWRFRYNVKGEEARAEAQNLIDKKLKDAGFSYVSKDDEKWVAKLKNAEADTETYVSILYGWRTEFRFYVYEQRYLSDGHPQTITFDPSVPQSDKVIFRTPFDGKHLYFLKIEVLEGQGANISFKSDLEDQDLRIRYSTSQKCDSQYYQTYQMFNLPPYRGGHVVSVAGIGEKKSVVKVSVVKTPYTVPDLGKLERLPGMVMLKNSLSALPEIKPFGSTLGDFDPVGDYLPTGDAIYWLNNAYYSLNKNGLRSNLIPVQANQKTTVDWPLFYENMAAEEASANTQAGNAKTKIAIYGVEKTKDDTVVVKFSASNLPKSRKLSKDDLSFFEGADVQAEIISLDHLHEPMNVVILLDSSGSMGKNMNTALASVEAFIQKLPADAHVTVVDFDTKVKPLKATSRDELLQKLRKVRSNGATALYDSIIQGLDLLNGKSRASIVLFTDGRDANYNDTKRGSKSTFEEMIKKVQEKHIPIYPVAFGKKADTTTLSAIAKMTKTTHYQGVDRESLDIIFNKIRETLSSAYSMTVRRGKADGSGSDPVVNYMCDVSGSMDKGSCFDPDAAGVGNRYEPLKNMLYESVSQLPENYFIQLSTFSTEVVTQQVLTKNKARVLAGIGSIKKGGGTEIIKALKKGLDLCKVINTNRRYFIFVTDATAGAFKFDEDQEKELQAILLEYQRSGIQTFWLGMYDEKVARAAIENLAKVSGGESFISNDAQAVTEKILTFTQKIKDAREVHVDGGSVTLKLKLHNENDGSIVIAVGQKKVDFPILKSEPVAGKVADILYVLTPLNLNKASYNFTNAEQIYGDDQPLKNVRLRKIIPLLDSAQQPVHGSNDAVKFQLSKAFLFDRLKDINAGSSNQFLVLDVEMTNILKAQDVVVLSDGSNHPSSWIGTSNNDYQTVKAIPTYRIPNLASHLFVRINDGNEVAFHPITWLLKKPLTSIDQVKVSIPGDGTLQGMLAFRIPNQPITALSLHFFDTAYGHIDLPIIGEMKITKNDITQLPQTAPVKLGDSFGLSVNSVRFEGEIDEIIAQNDKTPGTFEVLNCTLDSKVNALLSLDPKKRFHLKVHGADGDWIFSPHPITQRIPMGIYKKLSVAPGSHNAFALAFQIPIALKKLPQSLVVDLKGDDVSIPIPLPNADQQGNTPTENQARASGIATAEEDGIKLTVNRLYLDRDNTVIADITLDDAADYTSTRLHNFLAISTSPTANLKGRAVKSAGNAASHRGLGGFSNHSDNQKDIGKFVGIDSETSDYLLGFSPLVIDGAKQRSLVFFNIKSLDHDGPMYLTSPIFKGIQIPLDLKSLKGISKKDSWQLLKKVAVPDYSYGETLGRLLLKEREKRAKQREMAKVAASPLVGLDSPEELPQSVSPISPCYTGFKALAEIHSLADALDALKKTSWVPAADDDSYYSPASMLTQQWGTEYDQIQLVAKILRASNIEQQVNSYQLTKAGKQRLESMSNGIPVVLKYVPVMLWKDDDGTPHSLVFPFLKSVDDLLNEVDSSKTKRLSLGTRTGHIQFRLIWKDAVTSAGAQIGSAASALGGGQGSKKHDENVFNTNFNVHDSGESPVDISFSEGKDEKGKEVMNIHYSTTEGIALKSFAFAKNAIPLEMKIEIYNGINVIEPRTIFFKGNQKLSDLFLTFSVGAPDLSSQSIKAMSDLAASKFKNIKKTDPLTLAQWANRKKIYTFIGAQTRYENDLAQDLGVKVKHNRQLRCLVAMLRRTHDGQFISSLDLRSVQPDVYSKDESAQKSYHLMQGILATQAEGVALGGENANALHVCSLWKSTENLKVITLLPGHRHDAVELLKKRGVPQSILDRLDVTGRIWLFPNQPSNGHFGWLEIDPETLAITSVLDNGGFGSMTETIITQENIETTTRYMLGRLVGTNIAVGSVINYALMEEDFETIKKQAQLLAKLLACYVKKMEAASGKAKEFAKEGKLPDDFDFNCDSSGGDDGELPKSYSDLINFSKGIDQAIAEYFSRM